MTNQQIPQRADWRRNRERLLAAAAEVVARDGASASLEEIARRAGLGSATLHRHFRSREALLTEVFHEGVARLAARARELNETAGGDGLAVWLEELTRYTATTRGLAVSLRPTETAGGCHGLLADVATDLAATAVRAGRLRPEVTVDDLLALANGIAIRAEDDPELATRLLRMAINGVEPRA
ncbi:TetR/AcrR family transcriptional regulator [Actinoallomurus sp. CA-150999]|uniref:TetR/AcrR family transcriptional regulator n=1 Tax=Actinoallomurus sp. CA-150999 TaxID=3239887 RepID=UPI003D8B4E89